nr:hypothetical protein [Tanacetum cinerariifolium]
PLPLILDNRGRRVIPFEHFINNDLEYLRGGASSRKYSTSVTKTKAADYRHIKWIEDLVPLNRESARDVYSKRRIIVVTELQIMEWHDYKHLDWILERLAFNVSLRMFTRSIVIKRRVEDLQLGVESYQKKLNLTKPDTYRPDLRRREAYTAHSNPRGFIYQNKDKKNRLMRIDELHKFSDGTLNDVRNALDDCLKGIQMQYLPSTIWRKGDKGRAAAMIQAIEKMLKTRRIMRSLEKFVGGRLVLLIILGILPEHPSDAYVFTMKMEILLESTSNKLMVGHKTTFVSDLLIDFQIKFSLSIGEIVTHWFTLIVMSALRRSGNENMLSMVILILRSILTDLQVNPTKPG